MAWSVGFTEEKMKKTWCIFLLVFMVVAYGAGYYQGSRQPKAKDVFIPVVGKVIRDTVRLERTIPTPIPANVDTANIIQQYYSRMVYSDTLQLPDNIGYVSLMDTLFHNRIDSRIYDYKINIGHRKYDNEFMIGGDIGQHIRLLSIGYRRKNWTYKLGYDIRNNGVVLGVNYRISQW